MTEGTHVGSVESLEALHEALQRFAPRAQEAIRLLNFDIHKKVSIIADRHHDLLAQREHWRQEAEQARYDEDEESEQYAEGELREVEANLRVARYWKAQVEEKLHAYTAQAQKVREIADSQSAKARFALGRKLDELHDYLSSGNIGDIPAAGPGLPRVSATDSGKCDGVDISGFATSGIMDDGGVRKFIGEKIPADHVRPGDIKEIRYEDAAAGNLLGVTSYNPDGPSVILIYRHEANATDQKTYMMTTVAHEVGHIVYRRFLGQSGQAAWRELSWRSRPGNYVTTYAEKSEEEDFCESYGFYITDPSLLRAVSSEKYSFLRNQVFAGREYGA